MDAAIYFPLYIVALTADAKHHAIYYLSADLQDETIFEARKPIIRTSELSSGRAFVTD